MSLLTFSAVLPHVAVVLGPVHCRVGWCPLVLHKDEPTSHLDLSAIWFPSDLILEHRPLSSLVVTHDHNQASRQQVWNAIAELDGVISHHYKNEGNYALCRLPGGKRGKICKISCSKKGPESPHCKMTWSQCHEHLFGMWSQWHDIG
jgi:hypothetical protein